jgi:NAD(P)-dependent dehydrogenase (short-subunit alcohol dehydrogenase family)
MDGDALTMQGKVAVVTGATSGIGRWAAYFLARFGATTVLVGRGPERVAAVAHDIAGGSGNPAVEGVAVTDLASVAETAHLASYLLERFPRIDVLVNNAGAYFHRRQSTAEGLERTFALNVLSPFQLTSRLLPRLAASAPARVVLVASAAHRGNRVDLDDLQGTRSYRGYRAYGRSKLELILLAREFARRERERRVWVNAMHPGFVASGFGKNNRGAIGATIGFLSHAFGRSVRDAGGDLAYLASAPSLDAVTGVYFSRRMIRPGSTASHDPETARRLFELCEGLTKEHD